MSDIPIVGEIARDIQAKCAEGSERVIFGGYGNCMVAKISGIEEAAEVFKNLKMEEAAKICEDLADELKSIL